VGKLLFLLPVLTWAQPPAEIRIRPVNSGWKIVSAWLPGHREVVNAIQADASPANFPPPSAKSASSPATVLTVCEALNSLDRLNLDTVVIVGIFKSGMDETLRQDCPNQIVSGEVAWPNAVGLTNPANPPDRFTKEIQEKRAQLIAGYPAEAKPRPERVVGLYGRLASPAGLTSVPCCHGSAETSIPPARLFGLVEQDLRVIR
jgi:hypothetical protein